MQLKAVRGTKDYFGEESEKFEYVYEKAREVLKRYGYSRIVTPLIEHEELFNRGVGEFTDIVSKEMYTFEDKGGRKLALIPESTAPVVRAFVEHKLWLQAKGSVSKYFYFSPSFRYERPQLGRYRQFYQLGAEALGCDSRLLDIETIMLGYNILKELGISAIVLDINYLPSKERRADYTKALKNFIQPNLKNMCEDCNNRYEKNPLRLLDCKNSACNNIMKEAPLIFKYLAEEELKGFEAIKQGLNIPFNVKPNLVRGLDYYTGFVFEFSIAGDSQGAVLAGGRYNDLVNDMSSISVPAVGFAAGVERLMNLINYNSQPKPLVFIAYASESVINEAFSIAEYIRNKGLDAIIELEPKKLKKQLQIASNMNCNYAVIIGEKELEDKKFILKNMNTEQQDFMDLEAIVYKLIEEAKIEL